MTQRDDCCGKWTGGGLRAVLTPALSQREREREADYRRADRALGGRRFRIWAAMWCYKVFR